MIRLFVAVSLNPLSGLASGELQKFANELAFSALILCLIGWIAGAGVKAISGSMGNQLWADRGAMWQGRAFVAAISIAGAAVFINFAIAIGNSIKIS